MKTEQINRKEMINAKSAKDLLAGISKALPDIYEFTKFNDYRITTDIGVMNGTGFKEVDHSSGEEKISKLSLNKRKELRNALWAVEKYPTIKRINRLFGFLKKHLGMPDFKISVNTKQTTIQEKRKKYVEAREIAKAAYADYLNEKGDFYKLRLEKGQKV